MATVEEGHQSAVLLHRPVAAVGGITATTTIVNGVQNQRADHRDLLVQLLRVAAPHRHRQDAVVTMRRPHRRGRLRVEDPLGAEVRPAVILLREELAKEMVITVDLRG